MTLERIIVYEPHTSEEINAAITEFNDQMHDGAGIQEIQAGLHCIDFLCRRSEIDDNTQARLDGCLCEAQMRIELLTAQEAEQRSYEEQMRLTIASVRNMKQQAEHILKLARTGHYSALPNRYYQYADHDDDFEE